MYHVFRDLALLVVFFLPNYESRLGFVVPFCGGCLAATKKGRRYNEEHVVTANQSGEVTLWLYYNYNTPPLQPWCSRELQLIPLPSLSLVYHQVPLLLTLQIKFYFDKLLSLS